MTKEYVVLLHGVMRNQVDMIPMARYFKKRGYEPINIHYRARKNSLEDSTDFVHKKIQAHPNYNEDKPLNFVTHSMGGLIARYYIDKYKPANLGKVVMMSPPNTGSDFSDALINHKLFSDSYHSFFGPAGKQITTHYDHKLEEVTYPLGIIAGTRSINPLALWAMPRKRTGDHDGIVPVKRTKIEGMSAHITMPVTHTFMMFSPKVMRQITYFLENGEFIS